MSSVHLVSALEPIVTPADAGDARWWLGGLTVIKATAAQTGGLLTIVEITEPPGFEAGLHVHHREDEGFWILEGDATFTIGETTFAAKPGDFLFGPRDVPHGYTVGEAGCRILFILTPGGMEELITATSEPATQRTLPPPGGPEPDWEKLEAAAQAHGCEILS